MLYNQMSLISLRRHYTAQYMTPLIQLQKLGRLVLHEKCTFTFSFWKGEANRMEI